MGLILGPAVLPDAEEGPPVSGQGVEIQRDAVDDAADSFVWTAGGDRQCGDGSAGDECAVLISPADEGVEVFERPGFGGTVLQDAVADAGAGAEEVDEGC